MSNFFGSSVNSLYPLTICTTDEMPSKKLCSCMHSVSHKDYTVVVFSWFSVCFFKICLLPPLQNDKSTQIHFYKFFFSLLKRTHIDTYIIMYLGRTSPTGCTRGVFIWELPLKNGIFHWKSPWFTGNVCMFVCWFVGGVFFGPLHALQLLCNSHQSVYGLTLLP